jgi:hypothetical protein
MCCEKGDRMDARETRPLEDLRDSGLLWLVNRAVFHPRGYALAIAYDAAGAAVGWQLHGDGSEPWQYAEADAEAEADAFRRAEATLAAARRPDPPR